ncbi:MAG TPA: PQQ-binding-like beta-propeller repeat protein [Candidatus Angelobacter sp.]|nr:PQQ-binding-like beta-propeller repeat protein [Candidatus Angelobacter sp.]
MFSGLRKTYVLALFALVSIAGILGEAQDSMPASVAAASWKVNLKGEIRWQQVTAAGALLVCTDNALSSVDIEEGQVAWQKPELAGIAADDVKPVEGSLLMEADRTGLLLIFDPVTGAVIFDSRQLGLSRIVTRRVLPESGTFLVHGQREDGQAPLVALYDLSTGKQLWVNDSLFAQTETKHRGFGALMQGLVHAASGGAELPVLQAGSDTIVVYTLMGLRALDARTGAVKWSAELPRGRFSALPHSVKLYPSIDRPDRMYVSFDDSLMAYRLADGKALWAKPAKVDGWIRDIVQHPAGIVMLPEAPPENEATGSRRVINGVTQTGINVARYDDGTTIASKPIRMHGDVVDAMISGDSVVLAIDAQSRTFVNVLNVATASLRLKKDAKIKGQLTYAELTPAGLLYVSRPDASVNAEVNIIDLNSGEQKFKDAIESGKPWSGNANDYNASRYYLQYAEEGKFLYVFANRDHQLYAVDRDAGTFHALGEQIKLKGGEDPTEMEIRPEGIVLTSPQNLVIVGRDGQIKKQVYYPAPQLPGLLRALYAVNAVRAGLYSAAASAYGDAFAQVSRQSNDPTTQAVAGHLARAYKRGGRELEGYSRRSAAMAMKRFKASLVLPGFVFMLTHAPGGHGNVLLQIDKDSAQPQASVDLGREMEPRYAVDDISDMLFLETAPGTLAGYRLGNQAEKESAKAVAAGSAE